MTNRAERPGFDEAVAIVAALASEPTSVSLELCDALGYVTFAPVRAAADYPRFDASAMDGYAFASAATIGATEQSPVLLPIAGEARAGSGWSTQAPGSATRISTGAAIPAGYDTVLVRESASCDGASLRITEKAVRGKNIRLRGEDARQEDWVLGAGRHLSPEIIGALACYGVRHVNAARRPTIIILSTGDELLATPSQHSAAAIFDANGIMIEAMAKAMGLNTRRLPPVSDEPLALHGALEDAQVDGADIVVSTGGVSGGDYDYVASALRTTGATVNFHGVAMRPGKPLLFATLPNGALFFGLPGNPVAAALGFRFFVNAAVRAMLGLKIETGLIDEAVVSGRVGATVILKARTEERNGKSRTIALPDQRSHTMRPFVEANCWLVIDAIENGKPRSRRFALSPSI